MKCSSQGEGKVFAIQSDPLSSELKAVKREKYGAYLGTWTQKSHGAIEKKD